MHLVERRIHTGASLYDIRSRNRLLSLVAIERHCSKAPLLILVV